MSAIEKRVAVILSKSDAEDREAFEELTDMYYRKACRLKVKMPMRPVLVAAPRGIQARHAQPDANQSRPRLTVIRGGRRASEVQTS